MPHDDKEERMLLSEADIEKGIKYRLEVANRRGWTLRFASDEAFVRSLHLRADPKRVLKVLCRLVARRAIGRSRQPVTLSEGSVQMVTYWHQSAPTPDCVLAYRR